MMLDEGGLLPKDEWPPKPDADPKTPQPRKCRRKAEMHSGVKDAVYKQQRIKVEALGGKAPP